jgi:hypothetical protein
MNWKLVALLVAVVAITFIVVLTKKPNLRLFNAKIEQTPRARNSILARVDSVALEACKKVIKNYFPGCASAWDDEKHRLHATVAAKVAGQDEAIRSVASEVMFMTDMPVVHLKEVQVQKDAEGNPYSINILIDDDAPSNALRDLKQKFANSLTDGVEMTQFDRYYPRGGHITLISKSRCPNVFNPEWVDELVAQLNHVVSGKTASVYSVAFPDYVLSIPCPGS